MRIYERTRKKNKAEEDFRRLAARNGWKQMKRGWPDFFCKLPDGTFFAVEVKRRLPSGKLSMLKREQEEVLDSLSSIGVKCYMSDGKTLEIYDKKVHAQKSRRRTKCLASTD